MGLDIVSWADSDTLGNAPFLILNDTDAPPTNYVDISSIENWNSFSPDSRVGTIAAIDLGNSIGYANLDSSQKAVVDYLGYYFMIYKYVLTYDTNLKTVPYEVQYSVDETPYNMDYDVVGLHKRQYFVKGELLKVEYYGLYDPSNNTYTDLCVQEDRVYNRLNGFLYNRQMTISWYKSDGTVGGTKDTLKYYNTFDAIQAGDDRRENIVDEIKIVMVGLMQAVEQVSIAQAQVVGLSFLDAISANVTLYVKGSDAVLIEQVALDATFPFLNDVITMAGTNAYTIRDYITDELTIDYNKVYAMSDQSPFSFFNTI